MISQWFLIWTKKLTLKWRSVYLIYKLMVAYKSLALASHTPIHATYKKEDTFLSIINIDVGAILIERWMPSASLVKWMPLVSLMVKCRQTNMARTTQSSSLGNFWFLNDSDFLYKKNFIWTWLRRKHCYIFVSRHDANLVHIAEKWRFSEPVEGLLFSTVLIF